jgi:hypothetical protein
MHLDPAAPPAQIGHHDHIRVEECSLTGLFGSESGQAFIDALAASPLRDVDFERARYETPVRDVEL